MTLYPSISVPKLARKGEGVKYIIPKAKRARGEKLDSEIRNTMMRCACGATFDSWNPAENQLHAPHIYAAQAADGIRR